MKTSSIVSQVAPICKLRDVVDASLVNGNLLVASSANGETSIPSLVYPDNGFNNSDRVRQAFAKRNSIKFTDVRCCRMKTAIKNAQNAR